MGLDNTQAQSKEEQRWDGQCGSQACLQENCLGSDREVDRWKGGHGTHPPQRRKVDEGPVDRGLEFKDKVSEASVPCHP